MMRLAAGRDWGWVALWSLVFAFNLVVPLQLAWPVTERGGRLGMAVAVSAVWSAGLAVCFRPGRLRSMLVTGGALVGLSQVAPALQFVTGIVALQTWAAIAG